MKRTSIATPCAIALSAILVGELATSAAHQSQTFDEADHLLAGYRYWECGDFGANPEHPPLAKLLAAAPLLFMRLQPPAEACGSTPTLTASDYSQGRAFLYGNDAHQVLGRARLAVSVLALLLAGVVFVAAREMFGVAAATVSLCLLVFEPNLIAHGALVTTDTGVACFIFATVLAFYRYRRAPSAARLATVGLAAGLALATKHSAVLLLPMLAVLCIVDCISPLRLERTPAPLRRALGRGAELAAILAIGVAVLWASYGFRYAARPSGVPMTVSLESYIRNSDERGIHSPLVDRVIPTLERRRVLPESYLYGLANVLLGSTAGSPTYVLGRLYPSGRWFYFPLAFVIKSTLGFLLLVSTGLLLVWAEERWRPALWLLLPVVLYLAACMKSDVNIGVRHVLPIYPFLIVLAAGGIAPLLRWRGGSALVALALAAHVGSSLRSCPDYLAYSNEAWGGTRRTYRVLSDSNVDWGQGLTSVRRYLDQHPDDACYFAYFGTADPRAYGVGCRLLPESPTSKTLPAPPPVIEGRVLVSASQWAGLAWGAPEFNPYQMFQRLEPVAVIGGSVLVYHGRFEISLAAAMGRVARAADLLSQHESRKAVAEARSAVRLAPDSPYTHRALARALAQAGEVDEAGVEYGKARALALVMHPEFHLQLLRSIDLEEARLGERVG